ncbi:DMT family transporter [Frigoribacterium sp. 2-23]|uniref:DMT family transporter n=1 Tax=Frigoribacterium sp. 2-23 TaxID=3415006 RepID=UPI003C6EE43E
MTTQIGIPRALDRPAARVALTVVASLAFVASWSSGFVIAALATTEAPAPTLLLWRSAPTALVLLVVTVATRALRGLPRRELTRQALIGLFAQAGYCAFVYAALGAGIATGTTALIDAVQPIVVATLVGPLLGLRVRGSQWLGLGVGAVGVGLVVSSQLGGSDAPPIAYLLPAAAMACLVVGTFLQRRATVAPSIVGALTVHLVAASVFYVVLAAATGALVPPTSPSFWVAVATTAVFPTLMAYGLYWWLLRRIDVTALNALLFLVAPTTAFAGALLLDEPITATTLLGFALCAGGVAAVLLTERAHSRPRDVSV